MLQGVYNVRTRSERVQHTFFPQCETKFYYHATQQAKLGFCIFISLHFQTACRIQRSA